MEILDRECALCGEHLTIEVEDNGSYSGGHYWGDLLQDEEYWECDSCYREVMG